MNALQTASAIMPQFAKRTNEGLGIAEKGISRMMKAVRSKEGKGILDNLMGNFNSALGPLLNGLGNLAGYLARVASIASDSIPGIARTFERWSQSVLSTSENTDSLRERVNNVIQSAKDVGNFFMAAGRLMKAFFGGGVEAGQSFTRTMTDAMNRWTAFLNSTSGQDSLAKFFREAVAGTKALWSFLSPIISSFVRWATLVAPVARGFFEVTGAIAGMVSALMRLTALSGPITALLTTLGVLWGIGKVAGATRAITGYTRALFGMAAAQKAVAVSGAMGAGGVIAGGGVARTGTAAAQAATKLGRLKAAASGALMALTGLTPVGAAVAASVVGAGFAITHLATRTLDYQKAANSAAAAAEKWREAIAKQPDLHLNTAQAVISEMDATDQLAAAEKELSRVRKTSGKGSTEYKQQLMQVRQMKLNEVAASRQTQQAQRAETANIKEQTAAAQKRVDEAKKALKEKKKPQFDSWEDFSPLGMARNLKANFSSTTKEVKALEIAQARLKRQQDLATLASLNQRRALQGIPPIARAAATALGVVTKLGGKSLATKISLKFDDPGKAAKVAASAAKTLQSGVPKKLVTKIVADSKNAEGAVRRLQRARITPKRLEIVEKGGSAAVAMIQRLTGVKLSPKQQRIAQRGGEEAMAMLRRILGVRLSRKDQAIAERGGSSVLGTLNAIRSVQLPDKTQTIRINTLKSTVNTVTNKVVQSLEKATRAKGQKAGSEPINALIGEGADDEWRVNRRTGEVYKTDGPQFVHLDRDDAIIPTEPRYKARGKEIFKSIAKDLGLSMFAASKKPAPKKTKRDNVFGGSFGAEGFSPKATIPRNKTFKPSKRNKKPFTARRGWADYIEGLQTQQGYWEREVSIRESQVKEPADMVIETGSRDVTDPATGEVTKVPTYGANPEIENSYKPSLALVIEAMKALMSIIVELVRAIPQAIKANRNERSYHTASIGELNRDIKKEKNRKVSNKGDDKEKHERRLDKLRERRDKHVEAHKELKESEVTLNEDRVEAGFDQREAQIAQSRMQAEYDSASGDATAEAAKANADAEPTFSSSGSADAAGGGADSSTSGGAASDQLSYGQQASLADTERANVLREFGSNMMSAMGAGSQVCCWNCWVRTRRSQPSFP